jgi:hypothetical protein
MVLLFAVGVAILIIGVQLANARLSTILSSGGSALAGAALGLVIAQFFQSDLQLLAALLTKSERFKSEATEARVCSGLWHVYYSSMMDGAKRWFHAIYRLDFLEATGELQGSFVVRYDGVRRRRYVLEAGIRGKSLVLFSKCETGNEPAAVEIVSNATSTHIHCLCGVQLLESWDGQWIVSSSLFSRDIIAGISEEGGVDEKAAGELEQKWCKRCTNPTWRRRAGIGSLRVCADDTRVSSGAN